MEHLLKNHVTIMDFSKEKKVYPNSVYAAIKSGKITPDLVGKSGIKMIDLDKYRDFEFRINQPEKQTLHDWFARHGRKKQTS